MAKNLRKPKIGVKNPAAAALLLSFGCGVGVCILLLALAAFLLTHTGLPLSAVRPMACMAAAVGASVMGGSFRTKNAAPFPRRRHVSHAKARC